MAEVRLTLTTQVYGLRLAKALAWCLRLMRVNEDRAIRIGLRVVRVRITGGGRSFWFRLDPKDIELDDVESGEQ